MLNVELTKNKKYIIFFLVVLILIGLIVVAGIIFLKEPKSVEPEEAVSKTYDYYPFPNPPNKIYPVTKERCENQADQESKKKCFAELAYQNAIISQNPDNCLALVDDYKKDRCLFTVSKMQFNVKYCEFIKEDKTRELCIIETGIVGSDDSVCDEYFSNIPFLRKKCKDKVRVFDIIWNKKDIRLCEKIRLLEYGPLCYSYHLAMGQSCDVLEGNAKEECQGKMIITSAKTEEDCHKAISEDYKKVCLLMVQNNSDRDIDSDNDGKSNLEELNYRLDPFNPDTDGDGLMDGEELIKYHSDPKSVDTDIDGLGDYDEIFIYKTDINNPDTDNDGYQDGEEVAGGYNPLGEGKLRQ